mmetsp:Transcript_116326/g.324103  ORF Transcript_116326/g.324103 Transcript_116326/m.324103 type:complete len:654 (-) Transcript_116326:8-1969(-)
MFAAGTGAKCAARRAILFGAFSHCTESPCLNAPRDIWQPQSPQTCTNARATLVHHCYRYRGLVRALPERNIVLRLCSLDVFLVETLGLHNSHALVNELQARVAPPCQLAVLLLARAELLHAILHEAALLVLELRSQRGRRVEDLADPGDEEAAGAVRQGHALRDVRPHQEALVQLRVLLDVAGPAHDLALHSLPQAAQALAVERISADLLREAPQPMQVLDACLRVHQELDGLVDPHGLTLAGHEDIAEVPGAGPEPHRRHAIVVVDEAIECHEAANGAHERLLASLQGLAAEPALERVALHKLHDHERSPRLLQLAERLGEPLAVVLLVRLRSLERPPRDLELRRRNRDQAHRRHAHLHELREAVREHVALVLALLHEQLRRAEAGEERTAAAAETPADRGRLLPWDCVDCSGRVVRPQLLPTQRLDVRRSKLLRDLSLARLELLVIDEGTALATILICCKPLLNDDLHSLSTQLPPLGFTSSEPRLCCAQPLVPQETGLAKPSHGSQTLLLLGTSGPLDKQVEDEKGEDGRIDRVSRELELWLSRRHRDHELRPEAVELHGEDPCFEVAVLVLSSNELLRGGQVEAARHLRPTGLLARIRTLQLDGNGRGLPRSGTSSWRRRCAFGLALRFAFALRGRLNVTLALHREKSP